MAPFLPLRSVVLWLGDLNMRVETLARSAVLSAVAARDWPLLLQHEQLRRAQSERSAFADFVEGELAFAPSYKYDPDTDRYDTSEKARAPAWCDRVLWRSARVRYAATHYGVVTELRMSDHKPVVAVVVAKR